MKKGFFDLQIELRKLNSGNLILCSQRRCSLRKLHREMEYFNFLFIVPHE